MDPKTDNPNLKIYNAVREVPKEAQKPISAGRLKGKTDINPMWRIKCLTEQFGVCGFGWRYEITNKWTESGVKDEISAFVQINLYVKIGDIWSEAIQGVGGSSFVTREKQGPYQSDECYKMALTDAISVACKALGIGADVYLEADKTKYSVNEVSKKILPKNMLNDDKLLKWMYSVAVKKKKENKQFSVASTLEANYIVQPEDIQEVSNNLTTYMVANNLTI